jgi:hypothetical protein
MNMAIAQDEETLATSTSTMIEEPATPAVDAAADSEVSQDTTPPGGEEAQDKQPDGLAAKSAKQSKPSEPPKGTLADALDHLSGDKKNKEQGKQPVKPASKEAPAAKQQGKPGQPDPKAAALKKEAGKPAVVEPTAEELQAMPERTRRRFETILSERKQLKADHEKLATEYEAAKPIIEQGKAIDSLVEEYDLRADIRDLGDDDFAGVVIFQAALNRLDSGKGTKSDLEMVQKQFTNLNATMERMGIGQAATPKIDATAFDAALRKANEDLDFTDLQKLVDGLKAPVQTQQPTVQPQAKVKLVEEQPRQQRDQQAAPAVPNASDDAVYQARGIRALQADGITEPKAYFEKQLFPRILQDLKATYPGRNPVEAFHSLSPQAKHDLTIDAHQAIRKQTQQIKPAPAKPAPAQRANAVGGTKASWATSSAPATTSKAAIDFLAGE